MSGTAEKISGQEFTIYSIGNGEGDDKFDGANEVRDLNWRNDFNLQEI